MEKVTYPLSWHQEVNEDNRGLNHPGYISIRCKTCQKPFLISRVNLGKFEYCAKDSGGGIK
jgi:hypothetical protein